jgi:hypothetical protein
MSDIPQTTSCPNCGRSVEPGFRFCDSCGHKLDAPQPPPPPKDAQSDEPTWHVPIEDTSKQPSLLARMRERRPTRDEDDELFKPPKPAEMPAATTPAPVIPATAPKPTDEPPTGPIPVRPPAPAPAPPAVTPSPRPAPVPAQRVPAPSAAPTAVIEAPKTPTWRPIGKDEAPEETAFGPRAALVWFLHVVIAFAAGAVLLLAAGAVASLLSNGRTALLELRGLPIFLGGATSVIVFTLLRTGRARLTLPRRLTAISVVLGFVLLVGGAAIAYRPGEMHGAQEHLDRVLRVYGPTEKEAFDGFEGDITDWNSERDQYRSDILAPVLGSKPNVAQFRVDASSSEETLKGIVDRMGTHAATANNLRVRDALHGLASIYDDQMSGINLLTRGVLSGDQGLISQGDTRYKDAQKRSVQYFDLRVKPLLERAGLDVTSFRNAVAG